MTCMLGAFACTEDALFQTRARPGRDAGVASGDVGPLASCEAQDVHKPRDAFDPQNLRATHVFWWTGMSCVDTRMWDSRAPSIAPIGCSGADCASTFTSLDACLTAYKHCPTSQELPRRSVERRWAKVSTPGRVECGGNASCVAPQRCVVRGTFECEMSTTPGGRRCDENADCGAGTSCCVSDDMNATCRAQCQPGEAPACNVAEDCAAGESCCTVPTDGWGRFGQLGVCTTHACESSPDAPYSDWTK